MLLLIFVLMCLAWSKKVADRTVLPKGWSVGERVEGAKEVELALYLTQRNVRAFEQRVEALVDPRSATWGRWLSREQVLEMIAPSDDARALVRGWAEGGGLAVARDDGDCLHVRGAAAAVEALLGAELRVMRRDALALPRLWGAAHVPDGVAALLDYVGGLDDYPPRRRAAATHSGAERRAAAVGDVDPGAVTPQLLRQIYGVPADVAVNANSSLCLAEFQGAGSFSPSDLTYFQQQMGVPQTAVPKAHIMGPYDDSQPNLECQLDVQWGAAMASNDKETVSLWYWTSATWMLDFAQAMNAASDIPLVVSMSWGWPSDENCQIVGCSSSQQYVTRVNTEFLKLNARGVSLFAASGDQGAPGDENYACDNSADPISDIFPAGSPYVTAVGATMLVTSQQQDRAAAAAAAAAPYCSSHTCATSTNEVVCAAPDALITSGGGFVDYFTMPSWQKTDVEAYIKNPAAGLPPQSFWTSTNRAFPDVSACGHNYPIASSQYFENVDGTSASTPVVAALVSLINSARLNAGKGPIGFFAPHLYAMGASAFIDVTQGNNHHTEECEGQYGYTATQGWDACTGMGTPRFAEWMKHAMALP